MIDRSVKTLPSSSLSDRRGDQWCSIRWTMVFVSTILSLVPLFIVGTSQREGIPIGEFGYLATSMSASGTLDDAAFNSQTDDAVHLSKSFEFARVMGPYLGIALPVMMDVIVDIYAFVTQPMRANNVLRLSLLERVVFVVGVFVNGLYLLFPLNWNPMLMFTIQSIFANINTLLTAAPIVIFLERSTDVMTPLLTTVLIILLCSGIVALNFTFLLVTDLTSMTYVALYTYSEVSLSICFGSIILACFWSLFCYLSTNHWLYQCFGWNASTVGKSLDDELDPFQKFSVYKVPALHMIALCTMCGINIYWFNTPTIIPVRNVSLLNLLLLFSTSLILTIEMRVRQNEVMHGLFLLDSKKSFVRFISHEVRTPLSTALMGLELLGMDLNDEAEADENIHSSSAVASLPQEDFEALQLVHESLRVAAAIFDNLAEYDALGHEDQKMDLTLTSLNIATLIHRIVRPLQLQARRSNVEMSIDCLDAMVDVDQRRMDQAIRALVSTAIALTPKTGSVTISLRLENAENYDDSSPKNYMLSGQSGMTGKRKNTLQFIKRSSIVNGTVFATSSEREGAATPMFAILVIKYDGPGFDKADTRRVNKKMFSFDPRELHGGGATGYGTGSGLGLALAKFIADAHGGRLWVQSEGVGKGEELAIGLPLSTTQTLPTSMPSPIRKMEMKNAASDGGSDSATEVHRSTKQDSGLLLPFTVTSQMSRLSTERGNLTRDLSPPETNRNSRLFLPLSESLPSGSSTERGIGTSILHVLVVEDSAVARGMLTRMMKSLKCTTEEAADGAEAVDMVQASIDRSSDSNHHEDDVENRQPVARAFDLILCDSVMPNLSGPEAVKQIRAMGFTNPILGVTGNTLPEQVEDFIAHGVNDVLSKPVHFRSLKDAIARNLEGVVKETFINSINRASRNAFDTPTPRTPAMFSYREENFILREYEAPVEE